MLSRQDDRQHGPGASNDNGCLWGARKGARPGRGILAMASQVAGPIVLTYVADSVLIISRRTVH